jgi:hypothetical protein
MLPSTKGVRGRRHQVTPTESAVRGCVHHCIEHLSHTLDLARIAVDGPEPERAARYILDTLVDLRPELRTLRAELRPPPAK